ncbi:MAG: hypothetical protein IJL43_02535, partial [Lachnospiraceae bacterium]|nr:hypothetical protein [Lachnospiraceae bacterium]
HTADVKWNLTLSTNAVSMNVRYADIVKIGSLDGVKKVVIEKQYEAPAAESGTNDPNTANTSENMVGATIAWADGYTGAGSRIAIIDTGIDTTHQSFAAQTYFEYRTDMPANRDLTDEQLAKGTQDIGELTSVYSFEETDSATAGFVGKSLLLGNEIGIKYYMDLSNVPVKDNIRAEFTYITATGIESLAVFRFDEFEYNQSQNAYVVRLKTIAAKDAGQPVEARIIDGDTLISGVLTYSIESYAKSTLEDSSDERLRAVVTEMMKYCKSAEAYLVQ